MSEPLVIALVAAIGGGGFMGLMTALLRQRNNRAEADVTVSGAWQQYATDLKTELGQLKGELKAAQHSLAVLERKRDEALFWQAQVTAREDIVMNLLRDAGLTVPAMPAPPILREPMTRATDREAT